MKIETKYSIDDIVWIATERHNGKRPKCEHCGYVSIGRVTCPVRVTIDEINIDKAGVTYYVSDSHYVSEELIFDTRLEAKAAIADPNKIIDD